MKRKIRSEDCSVRNRFHDKRERDPNTVSQLLQHTQELQHPVNLPAEGKEFHDPDSASSSGTSHVPSQPVVIPSSRDVHSRDSGLPSAARDTIGNSGNISGSPAPREGSSSAIFENSRSPISSCFGKGPGATEKALETVKEVTRKPKNVSKTGGTFSHVVLTVIDYPRFPVPKMHLGKFPDCLEFQSWEVSFKIEVC